MSREIKRNFYIVKTELQKQITQRVVNISKINFNNDLDDYISKRRSSKPFYKDVIKNIKRTNEDKMDQVQGRKMIFGFLQRRIPTDEEIEQKIKIEQKKRQEAQMKDTEMEMQEEPDYEEEMQPKEGKIKTFVKKLFFTKIEQDEYEEVPEQTNETEELKETIKILHKWLEKLPPEKIHEFKNSEDFVKYKESLRKLGLIKQ